jgi:hypothetical protein
MELPRLDLNCLAVIPNLRGFCPALSDTMTGESPMIRAELAVAAIALVSTGAVASAQAQTETRPMHGSLPAPHKELEVKLDLAPDSLRALKKIPLWQGQNGTPRRRTEVSVYFDTDDHKLRKKGLMLRVRRVGRRPDPAYFALC